MGQMLVKVVDIWNTGSPTGEKRKLNAYLVPNWIIQKVIA
jgi:hypothetical protein